MSFLNIALLGGVLAFLVPLLIHLLNRSKFQAVDWGAMHLLESAMQVNSRRLQWKSWLLLMLRCLIPILLAICLARPVLTHMQVTGSDGQEAIAIVLDDSVSMSIGEADTTFDAAKEQLQQLIAGHPGAQKGLRTTGNRVSELNGWTFDEVLFRSALNKVRPNAGTNEIERSLDNAITDLQKITNPNKQLIVASDFAAADWNTLTDDKLERLQKLARSGDFPVQISLLSVLTDERSSENLSIEFTDQNDFLMVPGANKILRARVTNYGLERQETQIEFTLNGDPLGTRSLSIEPGQSEQLAIQFSLSETGWYTLKASLTDSAGLKADNQATQVIQVGPAQRVLLVTEPQSTRFEEPSDFLQLALAPHARDSAGKNLFKVERIEARRLRPNQLEESFATVVLTGVSKLSEPNSQAVLEFVRSGGGLVVFASDKLDTDWYRQRLCLQDRLLPVCFGPEQTNASGIGLSRAAIQSSGLEAFNSKNAGDLSEVRLTKWRTLETLAETEASGVAITALSLQDGSPLLVTQRFGAGNVAVFASSCGDDWSNLPTRPVYVPLMQQLVSMARANAATPNIKAGSAVTLSAVGEAEFQSTTWSVLPVEHSGAKKAIQTDSEVPETKVNTSVVLTEPGLFNVNATSVDATLSAYPRMVSVQVSAQESKPDCLSNNRLREIAGKLGATVVTSTQEFEEQSKLRRNGREIWRWLLVALLVALFAEILLGRVITRGD